MEGKVLPRRCHVIKGEVCEWPDSPPSSTPPLWVLGCHQASAQSRGEPCPPGWGLQLCLHPAALCPAFSFQATVLAQLLWRAETRGCAVQGELRWR